MAMTHNSPITLAQMDQLRAIFGARLQENVVMSNYITAQVGGTTDALLIVNTSKELENTVRQLWNLEVPFYVLGNGSNVLVSDAGVRGVIIINHARTIKIDTHGKDPVAWAESGANLGVAAKQAALRGFSGLEWAAHIPGSVGGAIHGNAGANSGDMQSTLILADILHREKGRQEWGGDQLEFSYRSSILKRQPGNIIILAARMKLVQSTQAEIETRMKEFLDRRHKNQPSGASNGSTFKNPPGDFAGRLIEAAGLKGKHIGKVEISSIHANFLINKGGATANDYLKLIRLVQKTVQDKFNIQLELEIELIGDWEQA